MCVPICVILRSRELWRILHERSYVLLNLLNKLEKTEKNAKFANHFIAVYAEFNNTGAGMLDSIWHMTLKLL